MLRNWVTQFGFDAGVKAGDERISDADRNKFIHQVGTYFGWNPPTEMNWVVEVNKDEEGRYVLAFMRYATESEVTRLLEKNYEKPKEQQVGVNYMKDKTEPTSVTTTTTTESCGSTCGCAPTLSVDTPVTASPVTSGEVPIEYL